MRALAAVVLLGCAARPAPPAEAPPPAAPVGVSRVAAPTPKMQIVVEGSERNCDFCMGQAQPLDDALARQAVRAFLLRVAGVGAEVMDGPVLRKQRTYLSSNVAVDIPAELPHLVKGDPPAHACWIKLKVTGLSGGVALDYSYGGCIPGGSQTHWVTRRGETFVFYDSSWKTSQSTYTR